MDELMRPPYKNEVGEASSSNGLKLFNCLHQDLKMQQRQARTLQHQGQCLGSPTIISVAFARRTRGRLQPRYHWNTRCSYGNNQRNRRPPEALRWYTQPRWRGIARPQLRPLSLRITTALASMATPQTETLTIVSEVRLRRSRVPSRRRTWFNAEGRWSSSSPKSSLLAASIFFFFFFLH